MGRKNIAKTLNQNKQINISRLYASLPNDELAGLAAEDPQAFSVLYDRFFYRVYYYSLDIVKNIADAEDVTSQTFLSAFSSLSDLRNKKCFSSWLFQIARNKANDLFRATKRRNEISVEFIEEMDADHTDSSRFTKDDVIAVRQIIRQLSGDDTELLRLKLVAKLTFVEISELTGHSVDKVKKNYYRVIREISKEMKA